jgi:hypothetical protein
MQQSLLLAQVHGGWSQAILRSVLMLINSFRILLFPSTVSTEISLSRLIFRARLLAIRDFWIGRYGFPLLRLQK